MNAPTAALMVLITLTSVALLLAWRRRGNAYGGALYWLHGVVVLGSVTVFFVGYKLRDTGVTDNVILGPWLLLPIALSGFALALCGEYLRRRAALSPQDIEAEVAKVRKARNK